MLSICKAGFIYGGNFQFGKVEECEVDGGRVPPRPCPQRFAGTQRPRGRSSASKRRTGRGFSAHRAKQLPRKAGATFTLRHSLASTKCCGDGCQMRTVRFSYKSEKSTFYIQMSGSRGTFTVTLRNLPQLDLSLNWVLLILILNTVTIHLSN